MKVLGEDRFTDRLGVFPLIFSAVLGHEIASGVGIPVVWVQSVLLVEHSLVIKALTMNECEE